MFLVGVQVELPLALSLVPEGLKSKAGKALMDSLWGLERSTERPGLVCVTDEQDMSGEAAAPKLGDCNGKTKREVGSAAGCELEADRWSMGGGAEGRGMNTSAMSTKLP